jgi:hypothetical protein
MTHRKVDKNGYIRIKGNPLSKVGVFEYLGVQIDPKKKLGLNPLQIYNVYRPEEELASPATIESFKLVPIIEDHDMLSTDGKPGTMSADEKGVHGTTGEEVFFEFPFLKSTMCLFSQRICELIESGKKDLSMGYTCEYDRQSGIFENKPYDFIQRKLRGNHIGVVKRGRTGPEVAVLDNSEITFDSMDFKMTPKTKTSVTSKSENTAAPDKSGTAKDEGNGVTLQELSSVVKRLEETILKMGMRHEAEALDAEKKKEEAKDEDEKKKKEEGEAKDEDEKKKKEKERDAMDAKLLRKEFETFKKDSAKNLLREISERDVLIKQLSHDVGVFDSADMSLNEVAQYCAKKLKLNCAEGQEHAAIIGYLAGKESKSVVTGDSKINKPIPDYLTSYIKKVGE